MANREITILVQKQIKKNLIKEETVATMHVLRDNIVGKNALNNALKVTDIYSKEEFNYTNI